LGAGGGQQHQQIRGMGDMVGGLIGGGIAAIIIKMQINNYKRRKAD
jgi:hypothetical protein